MSMRLVFEPAHRRGSPCRAGGAHGELEEFVADRKSVPISNRKIDGSTVDPNSDQFQILKGNEGWHTDSTYMPLSARASILAAQVVPFRAAKPNGRICAPPMMPLMMKFGSKSLI